MCQLANAASPKICYILCQSVVVNYRNLRVISYIYFRIYVVKRGVRLIITYLQTQVQRLFRIRIVRYALVGGIGIPVNLLALALFLHLMGDAWYPLALALSFEISTTANFFLNQLFHLPRAKKFECVGVGQTCAQSADDKSLGPGSDICNRAFTQIWTAHESLSCESYWYCLRLFLQLRHLQPLRVPANANGCANI